MARFKILILLTFLIVFTAEMAPAQRQYVVYLKDKANTSYDLANPLTMISQRALDRRTGQGIAMDSTDIPVNSTYVTQVSATGAQVIRTSKWLNALVVDCDSNTLNQILNLPFVINQNRILKQYQPDREVITRPAEKNTAMSGKTKFLNYGLAENQIRMLGADEMHAEGYDGDGVWVGVFDSGFSNADSLDVFEALRNDNRILGTWDIVEGDNDVYDEHNHGTAVLSCMAAYSPGNAIGTGFGASFLLFRTEDVGSETQLEEFNWLVAAEMADSMGVDIINTSLGYSSMDDPNFSHSYADMDGRTTIIARAATVAARKGILCVTSAGNEGSSSWFHITSPADADSIITVGAIKPDSTIAAFSSRGPSFDGRIKPNVVAQGQSVAVVSSSSGQIVLGAGTSFSGPLMAGFAAGLWQAYPNLTNMELLDLIQRSADRFNNPDNTFGHGIPNYAKAKFLSGLQDGMNIQGDFKFYPNPLGDNGNLNLRVSERMFRKTIKLTFYNSVGRLLGETSMTTTVMNNELNVSSIFADSKIVFVRVTSDFGTQVFKIFKD